MRKVIQIAISESTEESTQWCLCDDGSMWQLMGPLMESHSDWQARTGGGIANTQKRLVLKPLRWERVVSVPQEGEVNHE